VLNTSSDIVQITPRTILSKSTLTRNPNKKSSLDMGGGVLDRNAA
jgi:hypothetical protein